MGFLSKFVTPSELSLTVLGLPEGLLWVPVLLVEGLDVLEGV